MSYKRVVITEFGDPDVLKITEEAILPEPQSGQVRVRVLTTSASFTDTMIRKGMYPDVKRKPPFSPGYDMVGVVDELGEGATRFTVGQKVADLTITGAYSEYVCLPESRLVPVPDDLDAGEAVSLILSYVTAYQMLYRAAKIQQGQCILVHGAGGAVGTAILQLGGILGLEMYGTDARPKHELIKSLGAIPVDDEDQDFVKWIQSAAPSGVDVAFDSIGGEHFKLSLETLRYGGVLVAYGFYNTVSGKGGSILLDLLRLQFWNLLPNGRRTIFYSIGKWRQRHADWFREDLLKLFDLLSQGSIKPVIGRRMPLTEARLAHQLVEQAAVPGKIILMT